MQSPRPVPVPLLVGLVNLHPVILAVLDATGVLERLREKFAEIIVVGLVLKTKVADVCEVLGKLFGESFTEILDGSGLLLLANLLILLLVSSSLEALPRQATTEEVHENVAQGLEIISSGLLAAKMGVDGHVTGSSRKRFPFAVGNVLLGLGVAVLLRHTEINHVDDIGGLGSLPSDQEVIGLDIAVDQVLLVDGLDTGQLGKG